MKKWKAVWNQAENDYTSSWMKKEEMYDIFNSIKSDYDEKEEVQKKESGPNWETFLRIVDAISKGETPEWLTLKDNKDDKSAAQIWIRAIKENERRARVEQERIRQEAIIQAALDKLTDEEKKALGLKSLTL